MNESLSYPICPMEPGDVPKVVAIERLSFPTPWPASSFLYELSHNARSCYYVGVSLHPPGEGGSAGCAV